MPWYKYEDDKITIGDDASRVAEERSPSGELLGTRAYTSEENAEADKIAADATALTNREELLTKAVAALQGNIGALAQLTTISTQTFANNTQRDNAIKFLATRTLAEHRQLNALIRLIANLLDSQEGA